MKELKNDPFFAKMSWDKIFLKKQIPINIEVIEDKSDSVLSLCVTNFIKVILTFFNRDSNLYNMIWNILMKNRSLIVSITLVSLKQKQSNSKQTSANTHLISAIHYQINQ